mgnify:CR=1 FL=1
MNLEGKIALVTGSGRNIGRAIALKLAMQGASVAVNSRRNEVEAREVCEEILAEGGKALPFIADIGIESEVVQMISDIQNSLGNVSILINNAGVNVDNLSLRMKEDECRLCRQRSPLSRSWREL